jgi:hypothetical protein
VVASAKPTTKPLCSPSPCAAYNGYVLLVTGIDRNAPAGEFSKPEAGNHFVIVTLVFKNDSNDPQRPDSFCCKLTDSTNVTRDESFSAVGLPGCEAWQAVELAQGASLGPKNLCFEAGGDPAASVTLVWSPSFGAPDMKIKI